MATDSLGSNYCSITSDDQPSIIEPDITDIYLDEGDLEICYDDDEDNDVEAGFVASETTKQRLIEDDTWISSAVVQLLGSALVAVEMSATQTTSTSTSPWILDTGSSNHICGDLNSIVNYQPYAPGTGYAWDTSGGNKV